MVPGDGVNGPFFGPWGRSQGTILGPRGQSQGDFLVCRAGEDGDPDDSDVWVLNGILFPENYYPDSADLCAAADEAAGM